MKDILERIKSLLEQKKRKKKTTIPQSDLNRFGLTGIQLRPYQLDGVTWLTECLKNQQGCILGDEMGLGKTCQTISLLVYVSGGLGENGPFLVLSPLSVMENWRKELESFAPALTVLCYKGDKERRAELQRESNSRDVHVLLTTYELCLKDASFLRRWKWKVLVVDEAHRLKNQNSLLHKTLTEFSVGFRVLLTGTPIQNNLHELYSLLSFIQPQIFSPDQSHDFVDFYSDVKNRPELACELQSVLEPFLLRRVKSEVAVDLPKKTELLVYHGLSQLQKKYYKALLIKDPDAFGPEHGNKNRLLNILMNLRKCVDHPYLFDGVEPEPFEMGEHLVEASGKLSLLDKLLDHLHKGGHRVLLFSQMTRMLDILQDYMEFRGYSYERLDGSVRGEERNLAVKNFSSKQVFVFLLSTKAGGVGLNLTAADTVVFMDSDFNPQNDLQAAARSHRIGQDRPVKVVRLLARDTVEDIMFSRAVSKLQLTSTVMEEGRFSLLDQAQTAAAGLQLSEILKFGVDKLLASEESSVQEVEVEKILGPTGPDGRWEEEEETLRGEEEEEEEEEESGLNHMYYFEGRDYSKDPSSEDQRGFERLLEEQQREEQRAAGQSRALRTKGSLTVAVAMPVRKRKPLSDEELELRRRRRQEAAAKRAKLQEEADRKQQEKTLQKKLAWWESCGYRSKCLPSVDSEEEEDEEDEDEDEDEGSVSSTDSDLTAIRYVLGDVTHPHTAKGDAIIVHCVDDSGRWGRGGLFSALEIRSDEPRKNYELAGKMKDLAVGNVLLFSIDDKQSRLDGKDQLALVVAQHRDKTNGLSGILLPALDQGLKKIYTAAKRTKASVHLPRLGHATPGFNWYGTERLIRKQLASRGVPTYIYYHPRAGATSRPQQGDTEEETPGPSGAVQGPSGGPSGAVQGALGPSGAVQGALGPSGAVQGALGPSGAVQGPSGGPSGAAQGPSGGPSGDVGLPSFMNGVHVFFFNLPLSERKRLARYLITYDGDEEDVMSPEVTHIVAEVESSVQSQELQDVASRYDQAVAVTKSWLDSCFSKQRKVNTNRFLLR